MVNRARQCGGDVEQNLLDRPLDSLIKLDWEKGLYIVFIILALTTRLWGLGDRVHSHDECIHTRYSWNLYTGHGFQHSPAVGRVIADFIVEGKASRDFSFLSVERFEKGTLIEEPLTAFRE